MSQKNNGFLRFPAFFGGVPKCLRPLLAMCPPQQDLGALECLPKQVPPPEVGVGLPLKYSLQPITVYQKHAVILGAFCCFRKATITKHLTPEFHTPPPTEMIALESAPARVMPVSSDYYSVPHVQRPVMSVLRPGWRGSLGKGGGRLTLGVQISN